VQKRPTRGTYTGYGKRVPSDRPPVLSPKELALTATSALGDGQVPGTMTNGNATNGQTFSFGLDGGVESGDDNS
jgi:cell division protease FtsH